ncbi:MAG TPA: plastocyanin/azurin family copper-binding protein [Herpetosiphonaceae bacterium]
MKVRGWLALSALAIAIALAGCSRADPSIIASAPEAPGGGDTNTAAGPTALQASADPGGQLKFAEETLNAAPGQALTVAFNNASALPHSWVLVEPGQEAAVDQAASTKGGDPTGAAGVIAGSPVVNAGANATINVPALEPGSYPYICTVPGHYAAGMKGTLVVGAPSAGGEGQPGGGTEPAEGGGSLAVAADPAQLKFQQTELTGKADQPLSVAFENPSAALPHNWVLVPQGQEDAVVAAAISTNGDPTGVQGVLAGGKPITGSQETINVPPQPAGTYSYICTVPGHYAAGMKGTLTLAP